MSPKLPISLKITLPDLLQNEWGNLELAHQQAPITSIRLNPKKKIEKFDSLEKIPWSSWGYYLSQRPNFTLDPLLHAGTYYVQEASSMFLEYAIKQIVNLEEIHYALDLCAAPGGKSTHIASLLHENSFLLSNEVIGTRATILVENINKWGYDNTWVSNSDPLYFKKINSFFDLLFIDAPCSGSGLFRKIPSYTQDFNLELVNLCAQRQKRILADSWECLSKSGYLFYMTCSMSEAENEDVTDFIMQHFEVESCKLQVPAEFNIIETRSKLQKAYGYRLSPHLVRGEGFFLSVFQKKSGNHRMLSSNKKKNNQADEYIKKYTDRKNKITIQEKENLFLIPENHYDIYPFLSSKIKLIKKGVHVGKIANKELIPSHEMALFEGCNIFSNQIELNYEEAISYLSKSDIKKKIEKRGWHIVKYNHQNIGWIKNLGNRINNYYPTNYRILNRNFLNIED